MAVTLRDVARHAGVSPRSVSNVVNGFQHISPQMRERVQASIDALGYRPNLLARSLRQGRTGIITLLVPEITVSYFGELAHEIVEHARELGFTVMIDETGGHSERESALVQLAASSNWVDGVLLSSLGLSRTHLEQLGSGPVPVVLLGERSAGSAVDHVAIDNVAAAREAVRHLLDLGCTRVAALGGTVRPNDATSRLRLQGYRRELRAAGMEPWHVRTPTYRRSSVAESLAPLLAGPSLPDGLFCMSDELAVGALRELARHGVRVPEDVRVVGFDDTESVSYTTPSLTSVRPDRAAIAREALALLSLRIGGSTEPPRDVRASHRLVVRESSGDPALA